MPLILVVDDSIAIRNMLHVELHKIGFGVHDAGNGQQALDYINSHRVDLVITDNQMPFMTGLELVAAIRESGNTVPILVMSGDTESTREAALRLGANKFISKPFNVDRVAHIVQLLLSREG